MELELFDFIDQVLKLIEEKSQKLKTIAKELDSFFYENLSTKDNFLNIKYRIKSPESIKEKLLRYNLYQKYETPENILKNFSDLIGVRIECRFIEDEAKLFNEIRELFNIKGEDGYYRNSMESNILLDLDELQPQLQHNGFQIYKINGRYKSKFEELNFELQIKSLVNNFWGEIDHKVLYKNFNYMITENFLRDIMSSIKDNLAMVDRQLMLIFNHLNKMDTSDTVNKEEQIKALLSKNIHDVYMTKIKQEIGFVVDFKKSTDIIVDYLLARNKNGSLENQSKNFLTILDKLDVIAVKEIKFNEYISFNRELLFSSKFSREIGSSILPILNKDFKWNLLFKIIFDISQENDEEDFAGFICYLEELLSQAIMRALKDKALRFDERRVILHGILDDISQDFKKELNIDFISQCNLNKLIEKINNSLKYINTIEDWVKIRGK